MFKGELQQAVTALKIELLRYVLAMGIHGADADLQFSCDLLAGLVGGDQSQDAPLSRGQTADAGVFSGELPAPHPAIDQQSGEALADEQPAVRRVLRRREH